MQTEHPPHLIITLAAMVTGRDKGPERWPHLSQTVDSSRTPDLVWPLTSEDTAFPSPSCPHSLSPSWIPGVALSVGGPGECATKKGHRGLLSLPKSVSVPDRRAGVGAKQEALLSHTGQGQMSSPVLPKGCGVRGSFPHFCGLRARGWTLLLMVGRLGPWKGRCAQESATSPSHGGRGLS